jgi:hypothetical protein
MAATSTSTTSTRCVVCGAYPMKGYNWDKVLAAARKTDNVDTLKRASLQFAMNVHDEDRPRGSGAAPVDDGFVQVSKAATGMMLIERQVFDRLRVLPPLDAGLRRRDLARRAKPHRPLRERGVCGEFSGQCGFIGRAYRLLVLDSFQTPETDMPDNTSQSGGQDRKRINVNQDYELQDWSDKFGVTPERIKEAVQAVGDSADKVQQYLKGSERSGSREGREGGKSGER